MPILNRRRLALFLILLGLLLLGFGAWILIGMLWPKTPGAPGNREPQAIQRDTKPQPRTIALPPSVQGTSTALQAGDLKVSTLQEGRRRAESVVSRMGSGTSQDGFLGYEDAMQDGTPDFQNYLSRELAALKSLHPSTGTLYGITTRVISSKILSGKQGDDEIMVLVQTQKVEDSGDRAKPTNVVYEDATVTLLKQSNGTYLVSRIAFKPADM